MQTDSPLRWLRKTVFRMTQDDLAAIGGVSRPRISRYENGDHLPFEFMRRLRAEAVRRELPFSGDWFFEVPAEPVRAREDVQ